MNALIVCTGFDTELIKIIARQKGNAKEKYFIKGFPSLQADMFQQSTIQLYKVKETIGDKGVHYLMASAYDPFSTAQMIYGLVNSFKSSNVSNIYLSPLSTKPHAIAMALVYIFNESCPVSVIYPKSKKYFYGHTNGIGRSWRYTLEFPVKK